MESQAEVVNSRLQELTQGQLVRNTERFLQSLKNNDPRYIPSSLQELIETAKKEGADERVIETLQKIPERKYDGPVGVSKEVGKSE